MTEGSEPLDFNWEFFAANERKVSRGQFDYHQRLLVHPR